MRLLMIRPRPVPLPTDFVVKKGSNMRDWTPGGMPGPSSTISTTNWSSFPAGADANLAGAIYSGDRIINQIGPHLIEFTAVSRNPWHRAIECPNECHVFQFVPKHRQRALKTFVNVHLLRR